uniref:Uncharacterized protein n=1 Tax=Sphaerodactylus townsendi TaxID=933632 RepID=A0ACB8F495_9SAUR
MGLGLIIYKRFGRDQGLAFQEEGEIFKVKLNCIAPSVRNLSLVYLPIGATHFGCFPLIAIRWERREQKPHRRDVTQGPSGAGRIGSPEPSQQKSHRQSPGPCILIPQPATFAAVIGC